MSTQLMMLVRYMKLPRWRRQSEVQERDSHEEEGEEEDGDRRAEGASAVDNRNKAAVLLRGSENSVRTNTVTNIISAGDGSMMDSFPVLFALDANMRAVGFLGPLRSCISSKQGRFPLLVVGDALPLLTSLVILDFSGLPNLSGSP